PPPRWRSCRLSSPTSSPSATSWRASSPPASRSSRAENCIPRAQALGVAPRPDWLLCLGAMAAIAGLATALGADQASDGRRCPDGRPRLHGLVGDAAGSDELELRAVPRRLVVRHGAPAHDPNADVEVVVHVVEAHEGPARGDVDAVVVVVAGGVARDRARCPGVDAVLEVLLRLVLRDQAALTHANAVGAVVGGDAGLDLDVVGAVNAVAAYD